MYDVGAGFWVILHTTEGISSQGFCDGGQCHLSPAGPEILGSYQHNCHSSYPQQCEGDKVPSHTSNHHLGSNSLAKETLQLLARSQEAVQNSPLEQGLLDKSLPRASQSACLLTQGW